MLINVFRFKKPFVHDVRKRRCRKHGQICPVPQAGCNSRKLSASHPLFLWSTNLPSCRLPCKHGKTAPVHTWLRVHRASHAWCDPPFYWGHAPPQRCTRYDSTRMSFGLTTTNIYLSLHPSGRGLRGIFRAPWCTSGYLGLTTTRTQPSGGHIAASTVPVSLLIGKTRMREPWR